MASSVKWLYANGFNVRKGAPFTHLAMNGGRFFVPEEKQAQFYNLYAGDIEKGNHVYLVEQHKDKKFMPYIVDMEAYLDKEFTSEQIYGYVTTINGVVSEFFPDMKQYKAYVSKCDPTRDKQWIKNGIHVIYPHVHVTHEQALHMRMALIFRLTEKFGAMPEHDPWDKVIDISVYQGNGLRMPGSRKMVICSECASSREKGCVVCEGKGKIDVGRVYYPSAVIDQDGKHDQEELHRLKVNYLEMVSLFSLRKKIEEQAYPCKIPEWVRVLPVPSSRKRKSPTYETVKNEKGLSDDQFNAIVNFVKRNMPHGPTVRKAKRINENCVVAHTTSKYCENMGGNHKNATAYFIITPNEVKQRCFCTCDVKRKFGTCKEFCGTPKKISPQLKTKLFPEKETFDTFQEIRKMAPRRINFGESTEEDTNAVFRILKKIH